MRLSPSCPYRSSVAAREWCRVVRKVMDTAKGYHILKLGKASKRRPICLGRNFETAVI
jgi:hypothetical protein